MPQIINGPTTGTQDLLGALSGGLATGLENLTMHKFNQLQQRQELQQKETRQQQLAKNLSQLQGITPEQAQVFSKLEPAGLASILKQQQAQPQQQNALASIMSLLGGNGTQGLNLPAGINTQDAFRLAQLKIAKEQRDATQALTQEKFNFDKERIQTAAQETRNKNIVKENASFVKPLAKDRKDSEEGIAIIDRILQLLDQGSLSTPLGAAGLEAIREFPKVGKPIATVLESFRSPESQEADSLINRLILLMSEGGARPTNMSRQFTAASKIRLSMQPEALKARALELRDGLQEGVRNDEATRYVLDENKGQEPRGLEHKVRKIVSIAKKLPDPSKNSQEYPLGSLWQEGKYTFINKRGFWVPYIKEGEENASY